MENSNEPIPPIIIRRPITTDNNFPTVSRELALPIRRYQRNPQNRYVLHNIRRRLSSQRRLTVTSDRNSKKITKSSISADSDFQRRLDKTFGVVPQEIPNIQITSEFLIEAKIREVNRQNAIDNAWNALENNHTDIEEIIATLEMNMNQMTMEIQYISSFLNGLEEESEKEAEILKRVTEVISLIRGE